MPDNNNPNEKKDSVQYKTILSDDDGTNPRPIQKKKKDPAAKVRRELEEQQRQQRERVELLKLRQGIIEESDEFREEPPPVFEKPKGWKAVENFFYQYKWRVIIITFFAVIATVCLVQALTREKQDLYVLAISTSNSSGIFSKTSDIEVALERYCPDFDGNGKVHVGVNFINLSTENGQSQYTDSNSIKFSGELFSGGSQLYLSDEGILKIINELSSSETAEVPETQDPSAEPAQVMEFFTDFTDEYPDAVLYAGCGLQLNSTGFADEARWKSCPDTVGLYLRNELENMAGNGKEADEQRRRARIVYENIINNNMVNPDWNGN